MADRAHPLRPYAIILLGTQALLVAAYVTFPGTPLFALDRKFNLPSWFSAVQLAGIGFACLGAFEAEGMARTNADRRMWLPAAAGFFALSADEMLALHERVLATVLRRALGADSLLQAVLPWHIVVAPAIAAGFVIFALPVYTRLRARPDLFVFAAGGLGLWAISFVLEDAARPLFIPAGLYRLEVVLEESAEMLGAACLLLVFAAYAMARVRGETLPVTPVRWAALLGVGGALVTAAGVAIAAVIVFNPAYLHRRAGDTLVAAHDYEQAVAAYRRALAAGAGDADLWHRLARTSMKARRYLDAVTAYREAVARNPGRPQLWTELGGALREAGEIAAATATYEEALRIDPAFAPAHRDLGMVFEFRGEFARAEQQYRLAIRYDPSMIAARQLLANVLRRRTASKSADPGG